MNKIIRNVILCSIIVMLCATPLHVEASRNAYQRGDKKCLTPEEAQLKGDFRRLWIDHMVWTRNYMVSALSDMEDRNDVATRLLKNQKDIGNSFKPYYGEEIGNQLAELLREHILLAAKVLDAAKNNNPMDLEKYNKEWYSNADELAQFLSTMNPKWSEKEIKKFFYTHLELITVEVSARIKKEWHADILAYDQGETHMIMFADLLSDGIMKQFKKSKK
ncbi:glycosyltransferase [Paenibacillus sp. CMAA1364]